jgi:predicted MPP superfamily phosphohydrolase
MAAFVIVLALVGHVLLMRASMGFGYTLGITRHGFHRLIAAHAAVGILVPALILRHAVRADLWASLWLPWQVYIAACVIAVPIGVCVVAWRNRRRVPKLLLSNHTSTHDAVVELGRVPAPATLAGRVARLPGNECFRLDVRQREIVLPRLPAALDGVSILHLTDLHFTGTPDRSFYEWALERCAREPADLIALTGDIVDDLSLIDWLPGTLGELSAPLGRYFILGNHDVDVGPDPIRDAMQRIGWTHVGGRCATVCRHGHNIALAGNELPWLGDRPKLDSTASLSIALCHSPHEVRWARKQGIDLTLAGHLHGGQIQLPMLGPIVGGRFASGVFDLAPTVLHVGRGLGELAPLRFGCRPEIVKLVLRCPR